jgi:hypothetical protein
MKLGKVQSKKKLKEGNKSRNCEITCQREREASPHILMTSINADRAN